MKKGIFIFYYFLIMVVFSQEKDSIGTLSELVVSSKAPVTQDVLGKNQIQKENLAQDIPFLIQRTASAVATSDAGNGIGYMGIRIRGTDASRILVSIDGVPINDSESQSVFWVNMPDLASSAGSISIQRGVGSSSNGTSNFGGSVQINSGSFSKQPTFSLQTVGGSYGTYKANFVAESGSFLKDKMMLRARVSKLNSDGYVDRASSDLRAFQLEGQYDFSSGSSLKINYLSGKEKTYQAWYGVDQFTLEQDRKFNYAGAIYNSDYSEVIGFYYNQIDNYAQDHIFLNWKNKWKNPNWSSKLIAFYTYGRGYFEEFTQDAYLPDYKLEEENYSNLVRRKWLKNNFYGLSAFLNFRKNNWRFESNLATSVYDGQHFGKVIPSSYLSLSQEQEYYRNQSDKREISAYIKSIFQAGNAEIYGDLQLRHISYEAHTPIAGISTIEDNPNFDLQYTFFNPKIGLNYRLDQGRIYALWAVAQREPTRTDLIENPNIQAEKLFDWELGYQTSWKNALLKINGYFMNYRNQLVLSGSLDDVGNPIRENSGKSYRLGIETEVEYKAFSWLQFFGNLTWSSNKNKEFKLISDQEIVNLGNTNIAFSPNWIGNFGLNIKPVKFVDIQWFNQYIGEQYLNNIEDKNLKLDSYFLSNILLEIKPNISIFQNSTFTAQFNNIFSAKYSSNGYVYENLPYYYPQATFNFLAGIRLEW